MDVTLVVFAIIATMLILESAAWVLYARFSARRLQKCWETSRDHEQSAQQHEAEARRLLHESFYNDTNTLPIQKGLRATAYDHIREEEIAKNGPYKY